MSNRHLTDAEWRDRLTPEQYRILREAGTEPPFSGALNSEKRPGEFHCAACGELLFQSDDKYDSGSGWPSFTAPAEGEAIDEHTDTSHGMKRVEIRCSSCGSHLGHVFPDGPGPSGLRYCVNSASLEFEPNADDQDA
ncbi:peptide-methionine (R)-S-oxide reductase MsrB [Sphingomicrobium sp. XHP0235]|uniref:peptide-methionine (R)-S-oxide reductase MsrB n=1 Tax=Sphingomicrobium aquimarinum TaxID=3133971 RepID=UPI0031FE608F